MNATQLSINAAKAFEQRNISCKHSEQELNDLFNHKVNNDFFRHWILNKARDRADDYERDAKLVEDMDIDQHLSRVSDIMSEWKDNPVLLVTIEYIIVHGFTNALQHISVAYKEALPNPKESTSFTASLIECVTAYMNSRISKGGHFYHKISPSILKMIVDNEAFTYADGAPIANMLWAMGEEEYVIDRFCNDKTMYAKCGYYGPIHRAVLIR